MTRRRAGAPGTEAELPRGRRWPVEASRGGRAPAGATPSRSRLLRQGAGRPGLPEPGALRPLARALIDLAVAIEDEDEEDE